MEILGVLLGITMSAVALGVWWLKKEYHYVRDLDHKVKCDDARLMLIEHRKVPQPVVAGAAPEAQPVPKLRYRTWNEDAVMPEKSN